MPSFSIKRQSTRFVYKSGKIIATFEVDPNGKITYFDSPTSNRVKEYHFEQSDPEIVKAIAKMLGQTAKIAEKEVAKND